MQQSNKISNDMHILRCMATRYADTLDIDELLGDCYLRYARMMKTRNVPSLTYILRCTMRDTFAKKQIIKVSLDNIQLTSHENQILTQYDIQKTLLKLSQDSQELISLYYYQGYSFQHIGTIYGVKKDAIYKRLEKIKNQMRELMDDM